MKAIIKALLKSKIGKAILGELLRHFMLKIRQKLNEKYGGTTTATITTIALNEIESKAIEELCETDIHNV